MLPQKVTTLSNEKDFSIFDDDLKPKTWNLGKYKHNIHFVEIKSINDRINLLMF